MKVLLYCTKAKKRYRILHQYFFSDDLYRLPNGEIKFGSSVELMAYDNYDKNNFFNGKVVASFELNKVDVIGYGQDFEETVNGIEMLEDEYIYYITNEQIDKACISYEELLDYGKGKPLYAWHIDNLQIVDEPIELGELYVEDNKHDAIISMTKDFRSMYVFGKPVTKAPQSYQYVYYKGEKCLLLSVKSEHLVKILNGEKTIEIRKSVPKEVR